MIDFSQKWAELGIENFYSYYWEYQYKLGKNYIVPLYRKLGLFDIGMNVCEIGSAEGGVLFAFAEEGANYCLATDIAENRLVAGGKIASEMGQNIVFKRHDILTEPIPQEWTGKFDIVLLRDVIEHLDAPDVALTNIRELLRPNGTVFVTFPPYFSPFGGHQHLLQNFWGKVPYIHWLPEKLFHRLIQTGRHPDVEEVARLKRNKFSVGKFFSAVEKSGLKLYMEKYFILRPVYRIKFGLPTIPLSKPFCNVFTINVLATEGMYILQH
jgi:SAM-dependent methyltransferase